MNTRFPLLVPAAATVFLAATLAILALGPVPDAVRAVAALVGMIALAVLWQHRRTSAERSGVTPPEDALAARDRLLANVSHELRAPAAGILGTADHLATTGLDVHQADQVDVMQASARTMLALIDDLLDRAGLAAGEPVLRSSPVDLRVLVEGVADLAAPRARAADLALTTHVDPDLPDCVDADPVRLRQILGNLAGNAVKFTTTGGVAITAVRTGQGLAIDVKDSGPGIDAARAATIFEPFDRAGEAQREGSGLGLGIARDLARRMGGELTLEPSTTGAWFRLTLPLPEGREATTPREAAALGTVHLDMPDHPARAALATAIEACGHGVSLDGALRDGGHLICTSMPVTVPKGARITVIGHTGHTRPDGATGWLTWPVRAATLARILDASAPRKMVQAPPLVPEYPLPHKRLQVLLAEDDPVAALIARRLLTAAGHRVTHVADGAAAIAALGMTAFDLAIIDRHMPHADGLDVLRHLAGRSSPRAVLLTAQADDETRVAALEAGAHDCIAKPLDRDALAHLVDAMPDEGASTEDEIAAI